MEEGLSPDWTGGSFRLGAGFNVCLRLFQPAIPCPSVDACLLFVASESDFPIEVLTFT